MSIHMIELQCDKENNSGVRCISRLKLQGADSRETAIDMAKGAGWFHHDLNGDDYCSGCYETFG